MTNGAHWCVVHTRPNSEARAEINLRRQGFDTYLPCYQRQRRHARRRENVVRPLFPRYLFVLLDFARDQWRPVQSTFGVSTLVLVGDKPVAMPDEVVEEIRAREGLDGYVVLGLPPGLKPGSPVRMIDGLFADHEGVLDGVGDAHRVSVLLSLLGRQVRVFVPAASVAVA
jgi:transcriptional antiterminator RfaH